MYRKFAFTAAVINSIALILSVGLARAQENPVQRPDERRPIVLHFPGYNYTGPLLTFSPGPPVPQCSNCRITGTFTMPFGSLSTPDKGYATFDLKGTFIKFDFKISGYAGSLAHEWSSTNGAIVANFSVTIDASGKPVNWNIFLLSPDRSSFMVSCSSTAAFQKQYPVNPRNHVLYAGQPQGSACSSGLENDTFNSYLSAMVPGEWK